MTIDKIIIITQKTQLDTLVEKYNTKEQAKFYIEHMGGSFEEYMNFHKIYYAVLKKLKQSIPTTLKYQVVDKSFLPSFLFNSNDLVIVLGRDGLVINTAKYLDHQAIIAVNPDPDRIEGVLLPFTVEDLRKQIEIILEDKDFVGQISIAEAKLNTNQRILGVNDIFIGKKTHQSARYTIKYNDKIEHHSSSGIIISTGIGSTGWMKSVIAGAMGISSGVNGVYTQKVDFSFPWDAEYLYFCVREPWASKTTQSSIVFGKIRKGERLIIESNMAENGVIFSDGIENDRLNFNSGTIAEISLSTKKVNLYLKNF